MQEWYICMASRCIVIPQNFSRLPHNGKSIFFAKIIWYLFTSSSCLWYIILHILLTMLSAWKLNTEQKNMRKRLMGGKCVCDVTKTWTHVKQEMKREKEKKMVLRSFSLSLEHPIGKIAIDISPTTSQIFWHIWNASEDKFKLRRIISFDITTNLALQSPFSSVLPSLSCLKKELMQNCLHYVVDAHNCTRSPAYMWLTFIAHACNFFCQGPFPVILF